ncbi:hypothetical protein F0562_007342 [Nyssa sinensis]|uniref:PGG domain-containing protein n=1 Tax=Nyssa sinensis TaxID=561372 RepID=A0A5J5A7Z3_9ASTE|nr:hypothetical protein F0562_007342 [Nyssa sinensis]
MDQRLRGAAQTGNIDAFYAILGEDPYILDGIDKVPFVDSPLHIAAAAGHSHFAKEMMNLKPSLAKKLNKDGFSPMHLAVQNRHTKTVIGLVQVDADLIRVKGREGMTPLHCAAARGDVDLLAGFFNVCPKSIKDFTIRSETAMHLAVKGNMFEAFEVLVGWLRRASFEDAINFVEKVVRLLTKFRTLDINAKNLEGLTALDIIEGQRAPLDIVEVRDILCSAGACRASSLPRLAPADRLRSKMSYYDNFSLNLRDVMYLSSDHRNVLVVIGALILTITYQSGLSPPGGVWQDDYSTPLVLNTSTATSSSPSQDGRLPHHAGMVILGKEIWGAFGAANSGAFLVSLIMLALLIPPNVYRSLLYVALLYMEVCYIISTSVTRPGGPPPFMPLGGNISLCIATLYPFICPLLINRKKVGRVIQVKFSRLRRGMTS